MSRSPQTLNYGCLKTKDEWITIQQRIIDTIDKAEPWPYNLPKIRKKGDFFILSWDREQDMMMFMLKWA
jgi:hypothetical protein